MKTPPKKTRAAKPKAKAKKKAPAKKSGKNRNPIFDIFANMDEAQLAGLRQMMADELGLAGDAFGDDDPVELFEEFLDLFSAEADDDGDDDGEKDELPADLTSALSQVRIDANSGDRQARGKIQAIHGLLEDALEQNALGAVAVMLLGKVMNDAGWAVPDRLKQAVTDSFAAGQIQIDGDSSAEEGGDPLSSLLDMAESFGDNPFDVHDQFSSLLSSFPANVASMMLMELAAAGNPVLSHAVAGFVLHEDSEVALAAAAALAANALETPVESLLIERLVRMRAWLPPERQSQLDPAIRALRSNSLPPVKAAAPTLIKAYLTVRDGAGAGSCVISQRIGSKYQVLTCLLKPEGAADAMVIPDLPKSQLDQIIRQLKSAAPSTETDVAGVTRMLALALADNLAADKPPPYKLLELLENLGVGQVQPDSAGAAEIIEELLADLPPDEKDATAAARAHDFMIDSEFSGQWFEAGEEVDDLLLPIKGRDHRRERRAAKLIQSYLPGRRAFWARQCALSALAMRSLNNSKDPTWKHLALAGRDIASGMPLAKIPLMIEIAKGTVEAFELSQ